MASRPPKFNLGDLEMDRGPRSGCAVRDMVVTEIRLLRFSVALTCQRGQGSHKCASGHRFTSKTLSDRPAGYARRRRCRANAFLPLALIASAMS